MQINQAMKEFFFILEDAFAIDCVQALEGSVQLVRDVGVCEDDILKSITDVDDYILN